MTASFNERLDETIQAVRSDHTQSGADEAKAAILSLFREVVEEAIGEDEAYNNPNEGDVLDKIATLYRFKRNELRAKQRANLLQQLGEKKPSEADIAGHGSDMWNEVTPTIVIADNEGIHNKSR
jgi:uncharacterized protein YwqG